MKITALAGGVGGAKLLDGLAQIIPPEDLTAIINTGDDFDHWGMRICPDLDTVCYTLAGLANQETGWGRSDETWNVLTEISHLNGEDWFRIGDRDLATHIERTERLASGQTLTQIVKAFCNSWEIKSSILPMTDESVSTIVHTKDQGELAFQEYFVHQHCEPEVTGFTFAGIEYSRPAPGVLEAISTAEAVVFCPSNPWVSLDPILAVPGILPAIQKKAIAIAVSPIIGGIALKGPAAKMFQETGITPSAFAVADHYKDLISHFIMDVSDKSLEELVSNLGIKTKVSNILMKTGNDRRQLASDVLNFIREKE
jgi:LPPG:FO 2-phospho-L-lactate transferase